MRGSCDSALAISTLLRIPPESWLMAAFFLSSSDSFFQNVLDKGRIRRRPKRPRES